MAVGSIHRALSRFVSPTASTLNEIDVYARRLLSYDRLTPKELAIYVAQRRQALLFFATQNDPVLGAWKEEHPDEARFCSEAGWTSIPTGEPATKAPVQATVAQRANAARVLRWWSRNEQYNIETQGKLSSRLKLVGQPSDLKGTAPGDHALSAGISCLSLGENRILAAPCPESGEYHFLSDSFFIESCVSEHTQREEQYLTDLDARAELFIRRRVPFKIDFKQDLCSCGRPFPIIKVEN